MKRIIVVICLMTIAMGASAQGWRGKRKAKQSSEENMPVMAVFKAASNENFTLYFDGEKINEKPDTLVEVKRAKLNEPYNVRVVLKSPKVIANMNFREVTLNKQGEEYVVYRNMKMDNVEIYTGEEYRQKLVKNSNKVVKKIDSNILHRRGGG